jgi:hypothetical protein
MFHVAASCLYVHSWGKLYMKKTITIRNIEGKKVREREINYIPVRFILSIFLIILETVSVIVVTALCNKYIPYFYLAVFATEVVCVLKIINSDENPDYKIPWLLLVLLVPIAGFMIYFMFYDRRLSPKYIKRLTQIRSRQIQTEDAEVIEKLEAEDRQAGLNARLLCKMADTHVYQNKNETGTYKKHIVETVYTGSGVCDFTALVENLTIF